MPISYLFQTAVRIGRIPNKQKETQFADIQPFTIEAIDDRDVDQSAQTVEVDPEIQQLIEFVIKAHSETAKVYVRFYWILGAYTIDSI